ncbi:MAG: hypothetical protein D6679_13420, partial [Candidatus Hydrogenedentota bacterium]
ASTSAASASAAGAAGAAAGGGRTSGGYLFRFRAPAGARSISVAGSFNNWDMNATPMSDADGDGVWEAVVDLAPGEYQYKYVVNGTDWVVDPDNPAKADDGYGGQNSVAKVTAGGAARARASASAAGTAGAAAGGGRTSGGYLFRFRAPAGARSVSVAGSFNNWDVSATPMKDPDGDGIWEVMLPLSPGEYQYKYVVNGTDWLLDPDNPLKADDGYGGQNSVAKVGGGGAASASVSSGGSGGSAGGSGYLFRFRAPAGARSVSVAGSFNNWDKNANPMSDPDGDGVWEVRIPLAPGLYHYKFVINGKDWVVDPENANTADDGFGGKNSVLNISSAGNERTPGTVAGVGAQPVEARASPPRSGTPPRRDLWAERGPIRFSYRPGKPVKTVVVAGAFNDWSKTATPMKDDDGDGVWTAELELAPGKYPYKFVVDGNEWIPDPTAAVKEADGYGGVNSVLIVPGDEPTKEITAHRGDGVVAGAAIAHDRTAIYVTREDTATITLTLRVADEDVEDVAVVPRTESRRIPLEPFTHDGRYEYWRGRIPFDSVATGYIFSVEDGGNTFLVDRGGLESDGDSPWYFVPKGVSIFETPRWIRGGVIYHIFPDRFANGDPGNDPKGDPRNPNGVRPWRYEPLTASPDGWNAKYGGDLAGVIEHLDYLDSLGVTVIKFNPIFQAPSSAKYDISDYTKIDPQFGDDEVFRNLITEAGQRGMRILLDGVFNHSGDQHPFFRDVVNNGPSSPYYDYYRILKWPFPARFEGSGPNAPANYYICWWGFGQLPSWNTANPKVRDYLFSAVEKWMKFGIGGWRLDAPHGAGHDFWKAFRIAMKRLRPDAYLVGEVWKMPEPWLRGDEFDATMNYELRQAIIDFFAEEKEDAESFAARAVSILMEFPPQVAPIEYNHISSHDTKRFRTLAGGSLERVRQAAVFQYTFPGIPVIYYGDEVGVEGENDPDCRRVMPWGDAAHWDSGLLENFRRLGRLRRTGRLPAPVRWDPIFARNRVLVALSSDGERSVVSVFNASDAAVPGLKIPVEGRIEDGRYRDLLGGGEVDVRKGVMVLSGLPPRFTAVYEKIGKAEE